jgi:hypothetical protein
MNFSNKTCSVSYVEVTLRSNFMKFAPRTIWWEAALKREPVVEKVQ